MSIPTLLQITVTTFEDTIRESVLTILRPCIETLSSFAVVFANGLMALLSVVPGESINRNSSCAPTPMYPSLLHARVGEPRVSQMTLIRSPRHTSRRELFSFIAGVSIIL